MKTRELLHEVMLLAWQFVRKNGFSMSEALKAAWANLKLMAEMKKTYCEILLSKSKWQYKRKLWYVEK